MNKVFLIGNLTRDPESRTTQSGISLCTFTVAVNRRHTAQAGQPEADYFRVTAWRQLGDICAKHLAKGRKVGVTGTVSASAYNAKDGTARANLEVQADDVEFLDPKSEPATAAPQTPKAAPQQGYVQVEDTDLPF